MSLRPTPFGGSRNPTERRSMTDTHDANAHAELERLRERLAYYESFDQLIQKSVGDAGDILREAIEMRELAAQESVDAAHRVSALQKSQLESFRSRYSELLDDVSALQGVAERLARRLTDAIDVLEAELQPQVDFPALPNSLSPELASRIDSPADALSSIETEEIAALPEPVVVDTTTTPPLPPKPKPNDVVETSVRSGDDAFILLVHGVPNAATALNLKAHLEGLPFVSGIEPREFAAGMLRLQLQVDRELVQSDFRDWDGGTAVTVIHHRPGLLEVRLDR